MVLTGGTALVSLITTAVFIFINALLLMISTILFKIKDRSYTSALWVTAILGAASFVVSIIALLLPPIAAGIISVLLSWIAIGIALALYLIKIKYNLDWGKAALVWLVYTVFAIIAGLIIGAILVAILVAIGLSAAMAG